MAKAFSSLFKSGFALVTCSLLLSCAYVKAQDKEAVAVLTRYDVKPEYREQFHKALNDYVAEALANDSNIMAEAYYEELNPLVVWLIERWGSKSGLDKAGESPAFKAIESLSHTALKQPPKTMHVKDLEPLPKTQWRSVAKKEDQPLTIMLFVNAKPGTEDNFKEVYHTAMPQFRNEPGVINYQLSQLEEDSTKFVTYEKFRNDNAFQYHLNFPPIQPVIDYLNTSIKKQPFQSGLHRLIELAPLTRQ